MLRCRGQFCSVVCGLRLVADGRVLNPADNRLFPEVVVAAGQFVGRHLIRMVCGLHVRLESHVRLASHVRLESHIRPGLILRPGLRRFSGIVGVIVQDPHHRIGRNLPVAVRFGSHVLRTSSAERHRQRLQQDHTLTERQPRSGLGVPGDSEPVPPGRVEAALRPGGDVPPVQFHGAGGQLHGQVQVAAEEDPKPVTEIHDSERRYLRQGNAKAARDGMEHFVDFGSIRQQFPQGLDEGRRSPGSQENHSVGPDNAQPGARGVRCGGHLSVPRVRRQQPAGWRQPSVSAAA